MRVRDALTYAARLFKSGHRSDEAAALFALAREHYRLLAKIASVREGRADCHEVAVYFAGRALALERQLCRLFPACESPQARHPYRPRLAR